MGKRKAPPISPYQPEVLVMLGLTQQDVEGVEELRGVKARVRVKRTEHPERVPVQGWQDVTLYVQCYKGRVCCIAIEEQYFDWADYSIEHDYEPSWKAFMAEDYFMEIDYPGRPPDEVKEQQHIAEAQSIEKAVYDFFPGLQFASDSAPASNPVSPSAEEDPEIQGYLPWSDHPGYTIAYLNQALEEHGLEVQTAQSGEMLYFKIAPLVNND